MSCKFSPNDNGQAIGFDRLMLAVIIQAICDYVDGDKCADEAKDYLKTYAPKIMEAIGFTHGFTVNGWADWVDQGCRGGILDDGIYFKKAGYGGWIVP